MAHGPGGGGLNRSLLVAALVLSLALPAVVSSPLASAHDAHQNDGLDDQLVDAGRGLMVGSFDAPQQGPLLVVPYVHGELPCRAPEQAAHLLPLDATTGLSFAMNATTVQATVDMAPNATGYVGVALDTTNAIRTVMMMLEHAVAVHRMGAVTVTEAANGTTNQTFRGAIMGVPYVLPGAESATLHSRLLYNIPMPGDGISIDYGTLPSVTTCEPDEPGHVTLRFDRRGSQALAPGSIVHSVVLWDPEVPQWLPRPIPSTLEFQVNLYLTRSTEDPVAIQRALDPGPRPQNTVLLACLAVGLVWMAWPREH